jgi:hypothetical protein
VAIPTKEEFDDCIDILNEFNAQEVSLKVNNVELNFESLYDFYIEMFSIINEKRKALQKVSVLAWLYKDYGYKLAVESLFGKGCLSRSSRDWEQIAKQQAEKLATSLLEDYEYIEPEDSLIEAKFIKGTSTTGGYLFSSPSGEDTFVLHFEEYNSELKRAYKWLLKKHASTNVGVWIRTITQNLRDYYFIDDVVVDNSKVSSNREVLQAMKNLKELINGEDKRFFNLSMELEKLQEIIFWENELEEAKVKPFKQKSDALKERLLLFKTWNEMDRCGWGSNINVLCDLLTIEGIENRISRRTIERHVEKWRKEAIKYTQVKKEVDYILGAGGGKCF